MPYASVLANSPQAVGAAPNTACARSKAYFIHDHSVLGSSNQSAGAPARALSARRGAASTRRIPAPAWAGRAAGAVSAAVSERQSGFTTLCASAGRCMTGQCGSQGEAPARASRQSLARGDLLALQVSSLSPARGNMHSDLDSSGRQLRTRSEGSTATASNETKISIGNILVFVRAFKSI